MKIKITIEQTIPLYQKLAPKVRELKALGMKNQEICESLKICEKTVKKGLIQEN